MFYSGQGKTERQKKKHQDIYNALFVGKLWQWIYSGSETVEDPPLEGCPIRRCRRLKETA